MTELWRGDEGQHHRQAGSADRIAQTLFGGSSLTTDMRTGLYEKFATPRIDFYQLSMEALCLEENDTILEVGCGKGGFVEQLARSGHNGKIIGLDPSPYAYVGTETVLSQDGFTNASFVTGDGRALPFNDNSIDKYAANYMLYHTDEPRSVIEEAQRVVLPGGRLVFVTRGDFNLVRYYDFARIVTEEMGFGVYENPYLNFDAEEAVGILKEYFEIDYAHSFPNDQESIDNSSSLLRPMAITAEGWHDYFQSLAGMVGSFIEYQLHQRGEVMPRDTGSKIRAKVNELVSPIFFAEIEKSDTHVFMDAAQDKLIACVNTK